MNDEGSGAAPHQWVDSNGGPLIVLPLEIAHYWNGIVPPPGVPIPEGWVWGDPDGPVCDYDRAGDVDDYVGMVEVGTGLGLVLWDQPMRTAFIPSDDGGILVRWGHAYGEDEVWQVVGRAEEANWSQTEHRLQVSQGPLHHRRSRDFLILPTRTGHQMNQFKRWPLVLPALVLEAWIALSLFFAPGWANGWPFGLTIHAVWTGGMTVIGCLMLMTLAAGIGAAISSLLVRYHVELQLAWLVYRAWLLVCTIAIAILGIVMYRTLFAETLRMWPNGYHP